MTVEHPGAPDKPPSQDRGPGWRIPDAKDALDYLSRHINRMGRAGRLISLLIPLLVLLFASSTVLTWAVGLAEAFGKATDFLESLWLGNANVTVSVLSPPGVSVTISAAAGGNEIGRTTATPGGVPANLELPRGQSYSIAVTSDYTHSLTRNISVERTTVSLNCVVALAWNGDRRPNDVESFNCDDPSERKVDAKPQNRAFEDRIDRLEQSLIASSLALAQTQFETGQSNLVNAAGLASFTDHPPSRVDLTFGILQWSLRGCTLQPTLSQMKYVAPDAFRDAFGPGDIFITKLISIPCAQARSEETSEMLRAAFSGTFDTTWKPRFALLGTDQRIQDLEAAEVRRWLSSGVRDADCFGLHSKRALAVLFSVYVTSGHLSDTVWKNFDPPTDADEDTRLQALVQLLQSQGGPIAGIMARRLPALLGQAEPKVMDLGTSRFEPPGEPSACQRQNRLQSP